MDKEKAQAEVDLLAQRLEQYYMNILEKNHYRIFAFHCLKTEFDSPEKKGLKDHTGLFKSKSQIRKKHIVSNYFILENIRNQFKKDSYSTFYFCIDINLYEKDPDYIKNTESDFKEKIKLGLERKERNKHLKFRRRFYIR